MAEISILFFGVNPVSPKKIQEKNIFMKKTDRIAEVGQIQRVSLSSELDK
jgi:hypothetical protein